MPGVKTPTPLFITPRLVQNRPMQPAPSSTDLPAAILPFALAGQAVMLAIDTENEALTGIHILYHATIPQAPRTSLAAEVARQLRAYLDDPQHVFDLPLALHGTPFQRRLWSALRGVPAGETATYGQLVRRLGMRGGAQAVGQACRRNPLPIVLPCHRILARTGIGGYAGQREGEKLRFKRALLAHEGVGGG